MPKKVDTKAQAKKLATASDEYTRLDGEYRKLIAEYTTLKNRLTEVKARRELARLTLRSERVASGGSANDNVGSVEAI